MAKIAIIETGGKQYVVTNDTRLHVERLTGSYKAGDKVTFDKVLLIDDGSTVTVGAPYIDKATVTGEFVEEGREAKVRVIRYRPKSRYLKKKGHKQVYNTVKIKTV